MNFLTVDVGAGFFRPEELARRVNEVVPSLSAEELLSLIRSVLSVDPGRAIHGHTLSSFSRGIAADLDLGPNESELLAQRIEVTASLSVIAITSKAMDIANEHAHSFHRARVLTDIRPVFGEDAGQPPVGAVVTHVLRIEYFENGMVRDYFVALDNKDLSALKEAVDRALEKNRSLSNFLDSVGFSRFELSGEG